MTVLVWQRLVLVVLILLAAPVSSAGGIRSLLPLSEDLHIANAIQQVASHAAGRTLPRMPWVEPQGPRRSWAFPQDVRSNLHAFFETMMECLNLPGLAVAVVNGSDVFWKEGFGVRNEKGDEVDTKTVFGVGSTTKAFTAFLTALLVDNRTLSWDQPVREVFPAFRLQDPTADTLVTVRDLLSHRTGVPRHDLAAFGTSFTRRELVLRSQYMEPSYPIRQQWQYSNVMLTAAGVLLEEVTGRSWEDLVEKEIFHPLGMTSSKTTFYEAEELENKAMPMRFDQESEKWVDDEWEKNYVCDTVGPAGSIVSNVEDMAQWILEHLRAYDEKTPLLNGERLEEMHESTMHINPHKIILPEELVITHAIYDYLNLLLGTSYGLGWFRGTYRGHRRVFHGGDVFGTHTIVNLLPDEKIGFVILSNPVSLPPEKLQYRDAMSMYIMDVMLGVDDPLSFEDACAFPCPLFPFAPVCAKRETEKLETKVETQENRVPDEFLGRMWNDAYGDLVITRNGDDVEASLRSYMGGKLTSIAGDLCQWIITECDFFAGDALVGYLEFRRNADQEVIGATFSYVGDGIPYAILFKNGKFNTRQDGPGGCVYPFNVADTPERFAKNGQDGQDGQDGRNSSVTTGVLVALFLCTVVVAGALSALIALLMARRW
eukprot:TRINITY_DN16631_c0_g1_i1.p1 TRINITY_DN16631_c0_g1~~TRINITY_DN16631_c0_g1_i1.p1  ORF type:complete len:656 (+),score=122.71 TRINITY_DN16631_c0_g1_i1:31-1998(+)